MTRRVNRAVQAGIAQGLRQRGVQLLARYVPWLPVLLVPIPEAEGRSIIDLIGDSIVAGDWGTICVVAMLAVGMVVDHVSHGQQRQAEAGGDPGAGAGDPGEDSLNFSDLPDHPSRSHPFFITHHLGVDGDGDDATPEKKDGGS